MALSTGFYVLLMICLSRCVVFFFFFNDTATTEIYTLSLHDALPIEPLGMAAVPALFVPIQLPCTVRSEEHTSELQSRRDLVCRLLLEKKNNNPNIQHTAISHTKETNEHTKNTKT